MWHGVRIPELHNEEFWRLRCAGPPRTDLVARAQLLCKHDATKTSVTPIRPAQAVRQLQTPSWLDRDVACVPKQVEVGSHIECWEG